MIKLSINEIELKNVIDSFELDKKAVDKASRRALNKTANYILSTSVKEISKKTGIMNALLRQRIKRFMKITISAKVWYGLNPISLIRFLRTDKTFQNAWERAIVGKGIKVGKIYREGAFFAPVKKGSNTLQIFRRIGKNRLPIEKQIVEINIEIQNIVETVINSEYQDKLYNFLQQELKWELIKKS